MHSETKPCHLKRVALDAASRPQDEVRRPLVIGEAVSACHVVQAAEIGEEFLEGYQMGQGITDLHALLIVCAWGYAQDAVVRAELTARRLERIREVDLADDGRILVIDRQVVHHAD
jgi:hypothetical protein